MSVLRDILSAVDESTCDRSVALKYNKRPHATGEGDRYEERMLALVFLRCLKRRLLFQLSANNGDAGRFDDLVLGWRPKDVTKAHTLLVQLKHKTSNNMHIDSKEWLSEDPKRNFGIRKYCDSYVKVTESLKRDRVTFVLLTNAFLDDSKDNIFVSERVDSVSGLELLQAGGDLYKLNWDNPQVQKAVRQDPSFVNHFHLLCKQRDWEEILGDIYGELEELLGAGGLLCESISESLCKNLRQWMNNETVCLTSGWSEWQKLLDEYISKEVNVCRSVTTRLKYYSVADVRGYIQSCNPAWVRPPETGTAALSATKIHQALAPESHIMVAVEQFRELEHQILRCWGPFCRWLVILDDDKEDSPIILDELIGQIKDERRLVIVSSRGINCLDDKYKSSDVSDDSWNGCLNIKVRLNGDSYECHLRDLVAGVDALKSLLDEKPALLLALARLSQPLRMGRELETLPAHYVTRELADQRLLTDEFFSSLDRIRECESKQQKVQLEAQDTSRNTVIVVGRPGVGKSIMLSYVAKKIKERVPGCWLLRVNLLEFYTVLEHSDSDEKAVEGILRGSVFRKGEFGEMEYTLLRYNLLESPRVVCLVDGFDEVCPDYIRRCLGVLPLLSPREGKLLVTTRPETVKLLKAQMRVNAHPLEPFSNLELKEFFRRHSSAGNIQRFRSLNKGVRNLLRTPLFAEMFANLPQELGEKYDIVTLYEAFFGNKFRRLYEEKYGDNFSAPGKKMEVKEAQKKHEEQLMLLAASVLLRGPDIPVKLSLKRDYFVKAGIVYEFVDGKPAFLHRTFAEHFLAKWCFLGDGKQSRAALYRKAYVRNRLEFFVESFNRRAVRGRPLLEAVLDGDEGKVQALMAEGADPGQTDECGRNALHLTAATGTAGYGRGFFISMLQRLWGDAWEATLSAVDGLLGWTPMRYAAEGGRWFALYKLLLAGGDLSHLGDFQAGLHDPETLQGIFEQYGYWMLYQHVIEGKHPVKESMEEQIEFAVSLISAKVRRKCLNLICHKARKKGHMTVCSFLLAVENLRISEEVMSFGQKRESSSLSHSSATEVPDSGATPQTDVLSSAATSGSGQSEAQNTGTNESGIDSFLSY
ncbi:uncharacterized protein LOC126209919 [Schistocerca nitens]|uniref:uncharacterized protein LOC126209919 n=1 Tax=Schistocerca nitens TaxID=7011 RepID=UPI002117C8C6|nr:uncharacterized protein LOC126209919 [Schistocerca nitens]